MNIPKHTVLAAVFLCLGLGTTTGRAAAYLKLGDIKGESTDSRHEDWINILSMGGGAAVERDAATGLPTGRRQHSPIKVTKPLDKSTPLLFGSSVDGKVIPIVRLEFLVMGDRPHAFKVLLENATVISYAMECSSPSSASVETFSLNFETIKWTYTEFNRAEEPVRDETFYWNLADGAIENDTLPPGSFRISGDTPPVIGEDGTIRLRWTGFEEYSYRILGSETANGPYTLIKEITPSGDGAQDFSLPTDLPKMFLQIEKVEINN